MTNKILERTQKLNEYLLRIKESRFSKAVLNLNCKHDAF